MRINISIKEFGEITSHYASAEHGNTILDFVESYTYDVELLDEEDRVEVARSRWRELTQPIFEGEATLEILIYASIFMINYWDLGEMFMTDVLTPFERAMVLETMIDITKQAEKHAEEANENV